MDYVEDIENCTAVKRVCWDNPIEKYANFILDMPLSVLGIVTNILNIIVLNRRPFSRKVTAIVLLIALAAADLLTCLFVFPIVFCRCIPPKVMWQVYLQQFYDVYVYLPLANTFATASMWITVAVSLERYMSVVHAFTVRRIWTKRVTNVVILSCYFGAFAVNIPYFFLKKIEDQPPPSYTDWSKTKGAFIYGWIRLLAIKLIPIMAVGVLNYLLINAIWRFNKRRKNMVSPETVVPIATARQQLQMKITTMVVSVSVVLLVCHSLEPFAHNSLFTFLFGKCSMHGTGHTILLTTTNILETFSFASNFFFYCIFNVQFARTLGAMCCKCGEGDRIERHSLAEPQTQTQATH